MKTPNYPSIVQFQQLVELKDYRGPTQKVYVRKFAEHLQADPATATEDGAKGRARYATTIHEDRRIRKLG